MMNRKRWIGCAVAAAVTGVSLGPVIAVEPRHAAIKNAEPFLAPPLPLEAVRLTGGPLKRAQDADRDYLLKIEPDRTLAYLRERAGLPKKAEPYGGWDGAGRQLTGHIAGHYLSAVSLMYQATGDERFKQRADYIVSELKAVQDARGTGYIGAIQGNDQRRGNASASTADDKPLVDGELLFGRLADGRIESGGFDLNGMWAPWYVQHKLFAGLRDAYRGTGNQTALDVELRFAAWAEKLLANLTEAQTQKMLDTEFGGMNEIFADLYADTADARWLTMAKKFDHARIVRPLAEGKNVLPGLHGNTQIPKLIGSLAEHLYTGDAAAGRAARTFWDAVALHHSFATGGHGYDEYFGPPDKLSGQIDGTGQRSRSLRTAESCNVYNMLKMTRRLFALQPDIKYADFQERALFNHVLASIEPGTGRTTYMVPVGPGVAHEYQRMFHDFTCCVGSGMESHALHADGIYNATADKLFVNLYTPSTADWTAAGVKLTTELDSSTGETATIKLAMKASKKLTLALRRPAWAGEQFSIAVNGQRSAANVGKIDSFVPIDREWKDGDTIEIALPHTLRTEPLADNPGRVALFWGPYVLAGDYGPRGRGDDEKSSAAVVPVLPYADKPLADFVKPVAGKPGTFTVTTGQGQAMTLAPFYTLHERRYGIYWDVLTPAQWAGRQAEYAAEQERTRRIAAATVAFVQVGQMQPERDYNFQGNAASKPVRTDGNPGRRGGQWMSFDVPIDASGATTVAVTTMADLPDGAFTLSVDGTDAGRPTRRAEATSRFGDSTFTVPAAAVAGKGRVTVRLTAAAGRELPSVFGIRVVRADAPTTRP